MRVVEEFLNHDVSGANGRIEQNRVEEIVAHRRKTVAAKYANVCQIVTFNVLLRQLHRAKIDVARENLRVISSTRYEAGNRAPTATQIADGFGACNINGFQQNARAFVQVAARKNAVSSGEMQGFFQTFNFNSMKLRRRFGFQILRQLARKIMGMFFWHARSLAIWRRPFFWRVV